jgi:hypothetical protein
MRRLAPLDRAARVVLHLVMTAQPQIALYRGEPAR